MITTQDAAAAVGAALWDMGVGGVAEDVLPAGAVRLRGYLPPSRAIPQMLRGLRGHVRGLTRYGLDPGRAHVGGRIMPARRWARAWRIAARPTRLGRLVVAPTRVRVAARPRQIVIRIDPGMAFGSGAHPSTRLSLQAIQRFFRFVPIPPTVVDVGTGSGILAIAAAGLGAARVWARDVDPVAVAVARENVRANRVAHVVRVVRGEGVGGRPATPDLIVANIVAETIAALLPEVAVRLGPGGVFIGSGIVGGRLREVLRAGTAAGLERIDVLAAGEWRAVVLTRRGARGGGRPNTGCCNSRSIRYNNNQ